MILVLGGTGLLGNAVVKKLNEKNFHYLFTTRSNNKPSKNSIFLEDVINFEALEILISKVEPNVVINCISLTSEKRSVGDYLEHYRVYAMLPRVIEMFSKKYNFKYIHISSDGVFSGLEGYYDERSMPNSNNVYGRSKALGEPISKNSVCIRTSIYGHSQYGQNGILDWALSQNKLAGFKNYFFSGISTLRLAEYLINFFIAKENYGIYHIGGPKISKLELLRKIAKVYSLECTITEAEEPRLNFDLNSKKFLNLLSNDDLSEYSHDSMLQELKLTYNH